MSLLAELKRRNVIRMAGLYLVGAWLIVQVSETVLPAFDLPGWLVLAIGFVPVPCPTPCFVLAIRGVRWC